MFITILKVKPRTEKQQELINIFQSIEGQTRLLKRCMYCGAFVRDADEPMILYIDQWQTREDLDRHIQSPIFHWILAAMELAAEPPEINFYEVAQSQGLELIEELRLMKIPSP